MSTTLPPIYPNKDVEARPDAWAKVSSYVRREDFQVINSIACKTGTISFIVDQAIHQTAEHIRKYGYVPVLDTPRFFDYLRKRTIGEPPPLTEGLSGDDTGRTPRARESTTHVTDVAAGARSDVKNGSGGRRGKTRSERKKVGGG